MADDYNFTAGSGRTARARDLGDGKLRNVVLMEPDSGGAIGSGTYRNISLGTTGQSLKATAGVLTGWDLFNTDGTDHAYVKIYDTAGTPTSSDTPVRTLMIPKNGGTARSLMYPLKFTSGIAVRATKLRADNDNTAPTSAVIVNFDWA